MIIFALFAAACGSSTAQVAAERIGQPSPSPSPLGDGPEYGASLDEFADAMAEHDTEPELSDLGDTSEPASDAETIMWEDLIPPGFSGQEIVARFQDRLDAIEPGTAEATALYDEMQAEFDTEAVNEQLEGQTIRLAGFVAPLTFEDELVTEFLLVPTFGACIHVPPPPPNQTIMVTVDKSNGLTTDEAWGAVWVEGTLTLEAATTELAAASYTITNATSGVHNDF